MNLAALDPYCGDPEPIFFASTPLCLVNKICVFLIKIGLSKLFRKNEVIARTSMPGGPGGPARPGGPGGPGIISPGSP